MRLPATPIDAAVRLTGTGIELQLDSAGVVAALTAAGDKAVAAEVLELVSMQVAHAAFRAGHAAGMQRAGQAFAAVVHYADALAKNDAGTAEAFSVTVPRRGVCV
jgi:hypothetical protein